MFQAARISFASLLSLATAMALASCGSSQPAPQPKMRSPSYDYREAPRGGDDRVLGAHEQQPGDWAEGTVTNRHLGPGWEVEEGKLVPRPEQRNAATPRKSTAIPGSDPLAADAGVAEPETEKARPDRGR